MQVVPSLQKNVHSNSLLCSRWLRTLLLKSRGSRLPWSVSQFAGVIVLPSGYPHPHLFKLFWRNKNMGEAASSEIIDETSVHESYHIYPAPVSVATVYLPLTAGKQSQTKQQRLKSITSAPAFLQRGNRRSWPKDRTRSSSRTSFDFTPSAIACLPQPISNNIFFFPTCQVRVSGFYHSYFLLPLSNSLLPLTANSRTRWHRRTSIASSRSRCQWALPDLNPKLQISVGLNREG